MTKQKIKSDKYNLHRCRVDKKVWKPRICDILGVRRRYCRSLHLRSLLVERETTCRRRSNMQFSKYPKNVRWIIFVSSLC